MNRLYTVISFRRLPVVLAVLGLLMALPVSAEVSMLLNTRQFDNLSGLSHNTVYCVHQDSRGFMWFGTRYGLNRYDGRGYRVYHHTGKPGCIGGEYIQCIAEDGDGNLWVGTDKGLSVYDPRTDLFSDFDRMTTDGHHIEGVVRDICIDDGGSLWFIAEEHLFCYRDGVLKTQTYEGLHFESGGHGRVLYPNGDKLYFALSGTLLCSRDHGATFGRVADYTFEPSVLCEYGPDHLLVGSRAYGLYVLDVRTGELSLVPMAADCPYDATQFYPYAIIRYDDDDFIIGSEWGLFVLHNGELNVLPGAFSSTNTVDVVFDICKDRDGALWVANNFSGVNYFPRQKSMFECHAALGTPHSLTGDVVRAVAEDAQGNLWIGTEDGGLCRFNTLTRDFSHVVSADGFDLSQLDIQDLTLVGDDELAIGTYRGGLYLYNIKTGRLRHYMDKADVLTVYERRDHTLLFTVLGNVYVFNPQREGTPPLFRETEGTISDLVEDHQGRMWLTTNSGLLCFNTVEGTTKTYVNDPADPTSLCGDRLSQALIDSDGRLWLASESGGICCFNALDDSFQRMTTEDGLPSNAVNTLAEDRDRNLWVGTNNGFAVVDPNTRRVLTTYGSDVGLASKHITLKSAHLLSSGRVAFGTLDGLVIADPLQKDEQPKLPSVTLTGLYLYDEEILPDANCTNPSQRHHRPALTATMPYTDAIALDHDSRTFSLEFSTFDYLHGDNGTVVYKLDDLDTLWNTVKKSNRISFQNLPPGKYVFRICAKDNYTSQYGPETRLSIRVYPVWWWSPQAQVIYAFIIFITWGLIVNAVSKRRHRRYEQQLVEKNQEKEKELYQAKIDFFTNIAHEIRTPASLIRDPLHTLRKKGVPADVDATLAVVERNADSLNQLINELLDFRKVEVGYGKVEVAPEDLSALVREMWTGILPSAADRGLRTDLQMPSVPLVANIDAEATRKILRNLFSNALKFADSYVRLAVDVDGDALCLRLSNDGPRIPNDMHQKLFEPFVQIRDDRLATQGTGLGLPLALSLANLQGGSLVIDGEAPDNTFVLRLPLAERPVLPEAPAESTAEPAAVAPAADAAEARTAVLVVEDNADLRRYIADCLSDTYTVLEAADGVDGLAWLRRNDVQLVLTDVMMPRKDGLELLHDIKTDITLCHIPVVMLTAKDTVADHVRGLEYGADVYIGKPFDMERLKAQIASLLYNRKLLRNTYVHDPKAAPAQVTFSAADQQFMETMEAEILKHVDDSEWNIEDLAGKVGMSRSTLTRKIKALTDQTPNGYVRLVRLRRAAELLSQERLYLNEVCMMVGFSNPHYFSTLFQQQFGMKPSEYARRNLRG